MEESRVCSLNRRECAELFEKMATEAFTDLTLNKHLYHCWVDWNRNRAAFGLTFNDLYSKQYSYLKDLTPELFSGMVEILLQFQQHQTATSQKTSIFNYHFGWKKVKPFHLKILPYSLEDFRSTILHYVQNEKIADTLTYAPSNYTEYDRFETKLKFIIENIERSDVFHVMEYANDGRQCKFYISRRTHGVIAVNSIDMSKSEHPYHEVYHYARMLETRFAEAVGGVSFGVDHSRNTIWLWADCDEEHFETQVLTPHHVTGTGEFQQYKVSVKQLKPPKPEDCKAVHVGSLHYDLGERELKIFFSECGKIDRIIIPKDDETGKNKGFAFVHFMNTEAADKAVELDSKFLSGRKVRVNFYRENPKHRR